MIYAIGDIHGQHAMLQAMLDTLQAEPLRDDDILVFLGDYIDRGAKSSAVIETLLALRERRPNTIFLRGNHEQLLFEARNGPAPQPGPSPETVLFSDWTINWLQNGGVDTLLSYQVADWLRWWESIPEAHWEFLRATEMEYITAQYHFVHAGLLPPGQRWEGDTWDIPVDARLWIREPFLSSRASFENRIVVFGHTPQTTGRPLVQRNKIGLDTGAVFGGPLTAAAFHPDARGRKLPPPRFLRVEHIRETPASDLDATA